MYERIKKYKIGYVFVVALLVHIIITLLINQLDLGENLGGNPIQKFPKLIIFITVVFVAPVVETLLLNLAPIEGLQIVTKNPYIIILLSSVVFSLLHTYSIPYMVMTYFGGICLNTFYLIAEEKKGLLVACGLTAILHSVYNLTGFILIEVFEIL